MDNLIITAHLTIDDILNIDDVKGVFKIFYTLDLLWNDINVDFCFLQEEEKNNIVKNQTWLPVISEMQKSKTELIHKETTIQKMSTPFMLKDLDELNICEGYYGAFVLTLDKFEYFLF